MRELMRVYLKSLQYWNKNDMTGFLFFTRKYAVRSTRVNEKNFQDTPGQHIKYRRVCARDDYVFERILSNRCEYPAGGGFVSLYSVSEK